MSFRNKDYRHGKMCDKFEKNNFHLFLFSLILFKNLFASIVFNISCQGKFVTGKNVVAFLELRLYEFLLETQVLRCSQACHFL